MHVWAAVWRKNRAERECITKRKAWEESAAKFTDAVSAMCNGLVMRNCNILYLYTVYIYQQNTDSIWSDRLAWTEIFYCPSLLLLPTAFKSSSGGSLYARLSPPVTHWLTSLYTTLNPALSPLQAQRQNINIPILSLYLSYRFLCRQSVKSFCPEQAACEVSGLHPLGTIIVFKYL